MDPFSPLGISYLGDIRFTAQGSARRVTQSIRRSVDMDDERGRGGRPTAAILAAVGLAAAVVAAFALGAIGAPMLVDGLLSDTGGDTSVVEAPEPSSVEPGPDGGGGDGRLPERRPDTETTTAPATEEPARQVPAERIPPPDKLLLGVWTPRGAYDLSEADSFAAAAGRRPQALLFSQGWAGPGLDLDLLDEIEEGGMLPIVAWEPWDAERESELPWARGEQPEYALARILDGAYDEDIRQYARELAAWGHPVGMRFAHEMNGYWYPWAESVNGNRTGEYVEVWRHVHGIFAEEGADEVVWIWSPNVDYPGATPLEGLYPGDDYVDWAGLVGFFGHGDVAPEEPPTFEEVYGETLEQIRALTDKPILLTEVGATEVGGHKAQWISEFFDAVEGCDDLVGFVWFEFEKETDWRIVSSESATEAFTEGASRPPFDWSYSP